MHPIMSRIGGHEIGASPADTTPIVRKTKAAVARATAALCVHAQELDFVRHRELEQTFTL